MLRLLIVEDDDPSAAELATQVLNEAGVPCTFERVKGEAGFRQTLARSSDLILSDPDPRGLEGSAARDIAPTVCPEGPVVTGGCESSGPGMAAERGAAASVLKSVPRGPCTCSHTRAKGDQHPRHAESDRSDPDVVRSLSSL